MAVAYAIDIDISMHVDKIQDMLATVHSMFAGDNREIHVHNMTYIMKIKTKDRNKKMKLTCQFYNFINICREWIYHIYEFITRIRILYNLQYVFICV